MRYLFLALTVIVNFILTGAVFPRLSILDISPDIIICTMASITALEKSKVGAAIGFICGFALDIMFTGVIGFYTLPYFVVGMGLYFAIRHIRYIDPVLVPELLALSAFFIKELLAALLAYMLGRDVSLGYRLMRFVLPEMLATGLLMFLLHLLFRRLYSSNSIRPKGMEDLKKLL